MNINGYEIKDGILDLRDAPLTVIDDKAFTSCRSLREVYLPAGIEYIGNWAFAKCISLETVRFACDFRSGLFGRDVFKGCEALRSIEFADFDSITAQLLALCTNRLYYDHLLRSEDVSQRSWYEKWDICLATKLKSDDAEAKMSAALCGEEDISYDGIGSVDGEMPGEGADFVSKEAYNRSALCYMRLSSNRFISEHMRRMMEEHILSNSFSNGDESSFNAIFEECGGDLSYLQIYLDIVKPEKDMIMKMTAALPPSEVVARSYLIKKAGSGGDVFDDMML